MNPEMLLSNADFVSCLARRLIFDRDLSAEVAQQTMVAALERKPSTDLPLKPWLARVTRNIASKALRGESRRTRREHLAASPGEVPSTQEVVEREEARRHVVEAVISLKEPYRSVILLRYYEDLSMGEVAERLGVPLETARTRLRRGIERLRSRLDAAFGSDGQAWCLALVPVAGMKLAALSEAASGAAVALPGSLLTAAKLKVGAAALALAATVIVIVQLVGPDRGDSEAPAGQGNHQVLRDQSGAGDGSFAALSSGPAAEEGGDTPARPEMEPVADSAVRSVTGKVINAETGEPLPGVRVVADDIDQLIFRTDLPFAVTDKSGSFTIDGIPWRRFSLYLDEDFLRIRNMRPSFSNMESDAALTVVEAEPGNHLLVRVVGSDGRPASRARLTIGTSGGGGTMMKGAYYCDDRGIFMIRELKREHTVALLVRSRDGSEMSHPVLVKPGTEGGNEVTVRLEAGRDLRGIVTDPAGKPLEGIWIRRHMICPEGSGFDGLFFPTGNYFAESRGYSPEEAKVVSGKDGSFVLRSLVPGDYRFQASSKDKEYKGKTIDFTLPAVPSKSGEMVRFVLEKSDHLAVRVVDESGRPVPKTVLSVYVRFPDRTSYSRYRLEVEEDGTLDFPKCLWSGIDSSWSGGGIILTAAAYGYQPEVLRDVTAGDGIVTVVMRRGGAVSGRVLAAPGDKAVPSFDMVWKCESKDPVPGNIISYQTDQAGGDPWKRWNNDAAGAFRFEGLPPGRQTLAFTAEGYLKQEVDVDVPAPGETATDLFVHLTPAACLEGVVIDADAGVPLVRADVTALVRNAVDPATYPEGIEPSESVLWDEVRSTRIKTDGDGRFRIGSLPPKPVKLKVNPLGSGDDFWFFGPFHPKPGGTDEEVKILFSRNCGSLAVLVRDAAGLPVPGARVRCGFFLEEDDGFRPRSVLTDSSGKAFFEGVRAGRHTITVRSQSGNLAWCRSLPVDVAADQARMIEVAPGRGAAVRGTVSCLGQPSSGVRVILNGSIPGKFAARVKTRDDGTFAFLGVEPGRYRLEGEEFASIAVEIGEGEGEIVKNILLGSRTIKGRLCLESGDSLPDTFYDRRIYCRREIDDGQGRPFIFLRRADKNGEFAFEHLEVGAYTLYAVVRELGQPYTGLAAQVPARDAAGTDRIVIRLREASFLNLRTAPDSGIVPVLFLLLDSGRELRIDDYRVSEERRSSVVTFYDLVPGSYRLEWTSPSGPSGSFEITLEPGETAEREIRF